jgi:hypothetical protein
MFPIRLVEPGTAPGAVLAVSGDGYIRLPCHRVSEVELVHLLSGADPELSLHAGPTATSMTGFTEWLSAGCPAITLGWDWKMDTSGRPGQLRRLNWPRSNLMLCDPARKDVGPDETARLLAQMIDTLEWQAAVRSHLRLDNPPPAGAGGPILHDL